jgi:hypothetical protein
VPEDPLEARAQGRRPPPVGLALHKGIKLGLATIPAEDPRAYAMIWRADTPGVF